MKRIIAALILCSAIASASPLVPPILTGSNWVWTGYGISAIEDTNTWLSGVSILLTGSVTRAGSAVDLTGAGVIVRVGDTTTNIPYAGAVISPATGGIFTVTFQIPATPNYLAQQPPYKTSVQLTITNSLYTVTDIEQKQLQYMIPLH